MVGEEGKDIGEELPPIKGIISYHSYGDIRDFDPNNSEAVPGGKYNHNLTGQVRVLTWFK